MSDLSDTIEQLRKKSYMVEKNLQDTQKRLDDTKKILLEKYKIKPELLSDPEKLKGLIDNRAKSIESARQKLTVEAKELNDKISIA